MPERGGRARWTLATIIAAHCTLRRGVRSWACSRPSAQALLSARASRRLRVQRAARTGSSTPNHHIYPPRYATANLKRIMEDSGGALPASAFTNWSPRLALEQMDKAGVRSAIASMTSPRIWWNNGEEGRSWACDCNEFGAQMARDFPGRFG